VSSARVVDATAKAVRVVVPDYQLSLAIGKEGQNARLAARLTGCRIDIRSDAQPDDDAPSPGVGRPPLRSAAPAGARTAGRPLPPGQGHRPPPRRAEHPGPAAR
jgi:N utilization substance protein A